MTENLGFRLKTWLCQLLIGKSPENPKTPIFVPLIFVLQSSYFTYVNFRAMFMTSYSTNMNTVMINLIYLLSSYFSNLFIGIPMEITVGSWKIAIFYVISWIYPHLVTRLVVDMILLNYGDRSTFPWVALHLAQVLRNPSNFPRLSLRLLTLSLLIFPAELHYLIYAAIHGYWRRIVNRQIAQISGMLIGFLLGFYWIFHPKPWAAQEIREKWRNYGVSLTFLAGFMVLADVSGIHITFEEFYATWISKNKSKN